MKTFLLALMVFAAPAMAQSKDLRNEYLFGADLQNANLRGADLHRAQLGHADLRNADLRNASLAGAYLFKTDLRGADLRGAKFSPALKGAELNKTLLVGAMFDSTTELPFSKAEALNRGMVQIGGEPGPITTTGQTAVALSTF
jgi:uncharacterized protein YjbI with pentapeptide repeats